MQLGAFSISLAVDDLDASRTFYEALGFTVMGGDPDHGYLMLKNGQSVIGLFQGMFENNILTFNPGWDQHAEPVDPFDDVRAIQDRLKKAGLSFTDEADPDSDGPAHFVLTDPDGNVVMVDQHRPAPGAE